MPTESAALVRYNCRYPGIEMKFLTMLTQLFDVCMKLAREVFFYDLKQ